MSEHEKIRCPLLDRCAQVADMNCKNRNFDLCDYYRTLLTDKGLKRERRRFF